MPGPNLDETGKMVKAPLLTFERFIEMGMSCIVKLVIDDASLENGHVVQFSLTPQQCREIGESLIIAAQVIELERPTEPQ